MVTIGTDAKFEAAHRQLHDDGKCGYLHGHNWRVEFEITAPTDCLNECGYLVDYKLLKDLISVYDHKVLLNECDPLIDILTKEGQKVIAFPCEPTCENLANLILHDVSHLLDDLDVFCHHISVKVWENGNSWATVSKYNDFDQEDVR